MQNVILSALISRSNFADLIPSAATAADDISADDTGSESRTGSASDSTADLSTGSSFNAILSSMTAMQQSINQVLDARDRDSTWGSAERSGLDENRSAADYAREDDIEDRDDEDEARDVRRGRPDAVSDPAFQAAGGARRPEPLQVTESRSAGGGTAAGGNEAVPGNLSPGPALADDPDFEPDLAALRQQLASLPAAASQSQGGLQTGGVLTAQEGGELPQIGQEYRIDGYLKVLGVRSAAAQQTATEGLTTADLDNMARELNVKAVAIKYLEPQATADERGSHLENTLDLIRQSRAQLTAEDNSYAAVAREQFLQRQSRDAQAGAEGSGAASAAPGRITLESAARAASPSAAAENAAGDNAALRSAEAGALRASAQSAGGQSGSQGQGQFLGQQGQGGNAFAGLMAAQENMLNQGIRTGRAQSQNFMQFSRSDAQANASEIHERVMEMSARNLRELSIDLEPGDLGRMQINISLDSHNEALSVSLAAASPVTRELLEQTQGSLRSLLQQDHIELDTRVYSLSDDDGGSAYDDAPSQQGQDAWQQGGSAEPQVLFADHLGGDEEAGEGTEAEPLELSEPPLDLQHIDVENGRVSAFA